MKNDTLTTCPISEIKAHYQAEGTEGRHWFDRSSMRFFKTRFSGKAWGYGPEYGKPVVSFFITSEQGPGMERAFSVRSYTWATRKIDTVGAFNEYSRYQAKAALEEACKAFSGLGA